MSDRILVLFDIDGTLTDSGGAGATSSRIASDQLHGIPGRSYRHEPTCFSCWTRAPSRLGLP